MLRILCKELRHHMITSKNPTSQIHFNIFGVLVQNQNPFLKFISKISESANPPSVTVDYLVNSCGLPQKTALSAAKKFQLCSVEKTVSVISLFESYGLTKTHITKLISQQPDLLSFDSNQNLKPKIEFLHDLGFYGPDLSKFLASNPAFLSGSLQNQIIPFFNFLKSYISSTADILKLIKRWPCISQCNLEKVLIPNISILQACRVPDCNISKLLITQPRTLIHNSDRFKEIVQTVKKIGFDPLSPMFSEAVRTIAGMSKSSWARKLMVYQEFGWSDNDILSAFKKQPYCMLISEEKIRRGFEFFVEKLKCKPTDILLCPTLLKYSLEKRIVPRCAVLKILYSEGIRKTNLNLGAVSKLSEDYFLKHFVIKYQETVPEVMKAYKGGTEFTGFGEVVKVKELTMEASI